jgi:hypothetical protein
MERNRIGFRQYRPNLFPWKRRFGGLGDAANASMTVKKLQLEEQYRRGDLTSPFRDPGLGIIPSEATPD